MEAFAPPVRSWFESQFAAPTPVQARGWPVLAAGGHALLLAPTGSGKTLAAFLAAIDRLGRLGPDAEPGVRVLYVSPLKALAYDIERNLRASLAGIARAAAAGGAFRAPRVAVRTGDTPQSERRAQSRAPAEILVTTPESLYLILGSGQRETLARVETVIVDEIHALAPGKRGAHLALSLERLAAHARRDPQRVGLSATARPVSEVARFLGGDRPVEVVDAGERPHLELCVRAPLPEPAGLERLLEAIRGHRSTIVFANSRGLCERLARQLNERAGEEIARAHHGSLAHARRREIEDALKAGALRAIVATSSLELGIDMDAVDLVVLVASPGSVTRGLQRVGRAGHGVGERSRGLLLPRHRADLLEAAVVAEGMLAGRVEPIRVPSNPLDVLAQQIVAHCSTGPRRVDEIEALVRRAASFRDLSREQLHGVLDMLAGRYPSTDFADLQPRLVWDRGQGRLEARAAARRLALVSGGTIPDRGHYAVHLGPQGPRLGELDEEMVHETRPGEGVTLGASTWRVVEITRDRVIVAPAPGEIGKLPFWRGEGPGRPLEVGRRLGALVREIGERAAAGPDGRRAAETWLRERHALDAAAARELCDHLEEQRRATGRLPTDRTLCVERFRDELGDWRICLLSPFGSRVHAPWAMAIEAALSRDAGFAVGALWTDDGIALRFPDGERLPGREALVPDPEGLEQGIVESLGHSALFASQFRENAARALLLPRRRPGARTPLWAQRLRSQNLLAVARRHPEFPIVLETYRACLEDVFDLPGLAEVLGAARDGRLAVDEVETGTASPFARSLVFAYTAQYLYQGDAPVAERRAQALTLDRDMLRDLLGREDLRALLDAREIEAVEAELQGLAGARRARDADGLCDLLRRVGDLDAAGLAARAQADPRPWLAELERAGRALRVPIGGAPRWIAAEDAALYRDALGAELPAGLPAALLEPAADAARQLLLRFARTRGPFAAREVSARFGLPAERTLALLAELEADGRLRAGEFHPRGREREWCEPEVLRRLRRRTLRRLRAEVAPVEPHVLGRFLPAWHRVGEKGAGEGRLTEALERLEGLPLSFAELERAILPARVPDFEPRMLDERGALGHWVWVGCGALGPRDGRVALYRRERVALLAGAPPAPASASPLQAAILDELRRRGASFGVELAAAAGASTRALQEALWDLVWQGLVTNDTFAPLRALAARARGAPGRRRPRRGAAAAGPGRWSLVEGLGPAPDAAPRAEARALMLLERYGIATREVAAAEALPGGFGGVYPVLAAMEEAGALRRGHFVEGLGGAQFAFAGVVDRLRAARAEPGEASVAVLAASDPANPFGALLPWPALAAGAAARRAVGARVALVGGEPLLYLDGAGRRLSSFEAAASAGSALELALGALGAGALRGRRRSLRIESVDAGPVAGTPWEARLGRAGFRRDYRGWVLERPGA